MQQYCYGIEAVLLRNPSSVAVESKQCCYGIQAVLLWNPSSVAVESKQCCYGIQAVLLWNPSSVAMESKRCCYGIQAVLLWNPSSVAKESKRCCYGIQGQFVWALIQKTSAQCAFDFQYASIHAQTFSYRSQQIWICFLPRPGLFFRALPPSLFHSPVPLTDLYKPIVSRILRSYAHELIKTLSLPAHVYLRSVDFCTDGTQYACLTLVLQ